MTKVFAIFFGDLKREAQNDLLETFGTTEKDENWEIEPLAIIEREEE